MALGIPGLLLLAVAIARTAGKAPIHDVAVPSIAPLLPGTATVGSPAASNVSPPASNGADQWLVTVTATEHPGKTLQFPSTVGGFEASQVWLVCYVTLRNSANTPEMASLGAFSLVDSTGHVYTPTDSAEAGIWLERKVLTPLNGIIAAGASINSALLFDVAPEASGFRLRVPSGPELALT